jgi:NlpC/P60 family putative phage cell wall peptidase
MPLTANTDALPLRRAGEGSECAAPALIPTSESQVSCIKVRTAHGDSPLTPLPPSHSSAGERGTDRMRCDGIHRRHEFQVRGEWNCSCEKCALQPGAVLIFRIVPGGPAKHCGIVTDEDRFIHAYAGRCVLESWLSRWWKERVAGAFGWPEAGGIGQWAMGNGQKPSVIPESATGAYPGPRAAELTGSRLSASLRPG